MKHFKLFNQIVTIFLLGVVLPVLGKTSSDPCIIFETRTPSHLFYTGDKVTIILTFPRGAGPRPLSLTTSIRNDLNEEVRRLMYAAPDETPASIKDKIGEMAPGFYTYIADIQCEDEITKTRSFKFGVIRKPRHIFSEEETPFGVDAFLSWRCSSPDIMRKAALAMEHVGIQWVRDRISWNHIQPRRAKWDWTRYEPSQEIQKDADLRILQVFQDCAVWASEQKEGSHAVRQKYAPLDTISFYRFTRKSAEHFRKQVPAWEIWNEFDIPVFFLGAADDYARVLKAGYLGIKRGHPGATVLSGSVTLGAGEIVWGEDTYFDREGRRYVEKVFENGGGEYFDVFNVHHYGPVEGVTGKIRQCRQLMRRFGYDKPIWLTEIGSTSTEKMDVQVAKSEQDQAEYLVKAYGLALSEGVDRLFYFCLPSFVEHGASFWGMLEEKGDGWQPKPAMVALANLIHTLDGFRYYGRYETYLPVTALVFSRGSTGCMVLWSRDNKTHEASIFFKRRQKYLALRRIYGEDFIRHNLLVATVQVGSRPLFLHNFDLYDLDPNMLDKPPLKTAPPKPTHPFFDLLRSIGEIPENDCFRDVWVELRSDQGQIGIGTDKLDVEAWIYNLSLASRRGSFSLYLVSPSGEAEKLFTKKIETPVDEPKTIPFSVALDGGIRNSLAGNPEAEVRLIGVFKEDNTGRKTWPSIRYFPFFPPIEISPPALMNSLSGDLNTTVTVKNRLSQSLPVRLRLDVESRYRVTSATREITLDPHEAFPVNFALKPLAPETGGPQSCRAHVIAEVKGLQITKQGFLEHHGVARTFMPFEIDGKPGGWSQFQPFTIEGRDNFVQGMDLLDTRGDLRGKIYLAWDKNALYLFAVVADDDVRNPFREQNPWTGDALELFMDMRSGEELGNPSYGPGVFQIFVIPPDEGHEAPSFEVWQPGKTEFRDVETASLVMEDAYSLEVRIPWKNLTKEEIKPGKTIGFEATLDDVDEGDYTHRQLVWRGGANNWRDPSLFSRLVLVRHPKRQY